MLRETHCVDVLAIDQGTSVTKALVVSPEGQIRAEAEVPVALHTLSDGGVEQDPAEILASVLEAGRAALGKAPEPVGAVAIANQGEAVVGFDPATGRATTPLISWQDRRAASIVDRLDDRARQRIEEIAGLPADPYFTAPKLAWLAEQAPQGSRVAGIDAWLNLQLLGRPITDAATASRSGVLDLATRTWSEEAAGIWGLDPSGLTEVVDCAGSLGTTSAFGPDLPVTALVVDQQAALIGEDCLEPGEAKCTLGTGAFLLVTAGESPVHSRSGLSASVAWQLPEHTTWCLDGQVYAAGSALGWLERTGLLQSPAALDETLRRADPKSNVRCVPAFQGLGAPHWAPTSAASFEGIHLGTGPDELVAAVVEGICAQIALLVDAAEADLGTRLRILRIDGGLTRSTLLCQLLSDLLGLPLEVFGSPHATAIGLAALGRYGAGADTTLRSGAPGPSRTYQPQMSRDEASSRLAAQREAAARAIDASA